MPKLTEDQRVRYLAAYEGDRCPFCESRNLDTTDIPRVVADNEVTLRVMCQECSREWRDIFRLHDVEEIVEDDNG
jgi:transcriptional regulator NrdR family protein